MRIYVQVNADPKEIMRNRGLGENGKVAKYMASEVKRLSDPYVPMSSTAGAHMKNRATISSSGKHLIYPGPYAHYQHEGKVMAGRAPKHYTGKSLTYHGAPTRGANWANRMMADHREELEKSTENYIKGLGK